jgi:hypothetical protein
MLNLRLFVECILRMVASRYYSGRRPPSTLLFESTNGMLGDESELFLDIDD